MDGKYPQADLYQPATSPPQYTLHADAQPGYPTQVGYGGQPGYIPTSPGFVVPPPGPVISPPGTEPKIYPPPPSYSVLPAPTVVRSLAVGPEPMNTVCPSCGAHIVTQVRYESSTKTHILAAILCIIGCWPCVCIPYCMDSCQNGNHYCPACQSYLGTYKS